MGLTREEALKIVKIEYLCVTPSIDFNLAQMEGLVNKIYDDFEEEIKKAYIQGSNDNYKAMKEAGKLK